MDDKGGDTDVDVASERNRSRREGQSRKEGERAKGYSQLDDEGMGNQGKAKQSERSTD